MSRAIVVRSARLVSRGARGAMAGMRGTGEHVDPCAVPARGRVSDSLSETDRCAPTSPSRSKITLG
jgi:hypothetical protein